MYFLSPYSTLYFPYQPQLESHSPFICHSSLSPSSPLYCLPSLSLSPSLPPTPIHMPAYFSNAALRGLSLLLCLSPGNKEHDNKLMKSSVSSRYAAVLILQLLQSMWRAQGPEEPPLFPGAPAQPCVAYSSTFLYSK